MWAVRVNEHGGPEVLSWMEVPDPEPGPGEILVKVEAAGVNFIDTYQRSGLYEVKLPFTLGSEGAGEVMAVGPGVTDFAVGDRAAWCQGGSGTYAELCVVPTDKAVPVPANLSTDLAAASLLQGATAHYLVHDTFQLGPGHRCLVHAAAGGAGRLLVQMAKIVGAEVIATAGGPDKVEMARTAGADHVIDYNATNFVTAVEGLVGPKAVDVVYDGVGRTTFDQGLTLLRPRGMMVAFGNASGPPEPVSLLRLSQLGSLYVTRPTLSHYTSTAVELRARAKAVFDLVADSRLEVVIGMRMPMSQASEAHRRLEARQTTGKVLLTPG